MLSAPPLAGELFEIFERLPSPSGITLARRRSGMGNRDDIDTLLRMLDADVAGLRDPEGIWPAERAEIAKLAEIWLPLGTAWGAYVVEYLAIESRGGCVAWELYGRPRGDIYATLQARYESARQAWVCAPGAVPHLPAPGELLSDP